MSDDTHVPHDRLDDVPDEEIQSVTVTPQMLDELLTFGMSVTERDAETIVLQYDSRNVPQDTVVKVHQTFADMPVTMPHEQPEIEDADGAETND